jgi:hypothetical protein
VDEYILAAFVGLDKAKPLCRVGRTSLFHSRSFQLRADPHVVSYAPRQVSSAASPVGCTQVLRLAAVCALLSNEEDASWSTMKWRGIGDGISEKLKAIMAQQETTLQQA